MHDESKVNYSADEAAVRALYQQLMDGWNQGSGTAFTAVFTEDGDLVAFDGTHFKGCQEIAPFTRTLRQVAEGEPPRWACRGHEVPEPRRRPDARGRGDSNAG
jgi:hypothetical protein